MKSKKHSPGSPPRSMLSFEATSKASESNPTAGKVPHEPIFWRGYGSEEELASPSGTNDLSGHSSSSDSDAASIGSLLSFHDGTEDFGYGHQQCSTAQAITFVPAGKAKVITWPRLFDVPVIPRMKRPVSIAPAPIKVPVSRLSKVEEASQTSSRNSWTNSSRSSTEKSPISTAPSSPGEVHVSRQYKGPRYRPSLPLIAGPDATTVIRSPESFPRGVRLQTSSEFLQHDPYPSAWPLSDQPMTPTSPSRRRPQKFFGLNIFGLGSKRSHSDINTDFDDVKEPESVMVTRTSPLTTPSRRSSGNKMQARGGNERAPPLVLPPCPEDYIDM